MHYHLKGSPHLLVLQSTLLLLLILHVMKNLTSYQFFSFETEYFPTKGFILCEESKVSSAPHVLPTETEVAGSIYET